jgi:hypothetical protein
MMEDVPFTARPLNSGGNGWSKALWNQRMPPGYQPSASAASSKPSADGDGDGEEQSSQFIPGHLWGSITASGKKPSTDATNPTIMQVDPSPSTAVEEGKAKDGEDDASEMILAEEHEFLERTNTNSIDVEPLRPFQGAPFIPTSTQGSPKMALNSLYGKEMGQTPITESSYFYWRRGKEFECQFTCFLVCPATYEIFPAGRYRSTVHTASGADIRMATDEDTGIVWYSRKKEAAQGAAALLYDCWYYRTWLSRNPHAPKTCLFSMDEPYASADDERSAKAVAEIPLTTVESIQAQIEKWKVTAEQRAQNDEQEAMVEVEATMVEVEATAYRNAYLETRSGSSRGEPMNEEPPAADEE